MKKYYITTRQHEQAERMAEKLRARAEAFYSGGDGWGSATVGYCKTEDEAGQAEDNANRIHEAIARLTCGCGTWTDVKVIQVAVADRDAIDAGIAIRRDMAQS